MMKECLCLRRFLSVFLILALLCTAIPVLGEGVDTTEEEYNDEVEDMYSGYTESGYPTLQKGDCDTDEAVAVLILQQALVGYGYLRGAADGSYGSNTEKAVAAFQRNNGLEETGIADPETQDKLFNGTDIVVSEDSMDAESVVYRTQKKLAQWGFYPENVDGISGDSTNKAVRNFRRYLQSYYLVNPTPDPNALTTPEPIEPSGYGDADVALDELLVVEEEVPDVDAEIAIDAEILNFVDGTYDFVTYSRSVSDGETGDEVDRVQRRLHFLKYLAVMNGTMDSATERALLYFQKKNGLTLSGIADEATQQILFSENAVPSEEYINAYKVVVNKTEQRVHVYQWNGTDYSMQVKEFICSTGMRGAETETPSGTFQAVGPSGTGEWYYFKKYECFAKWGYFIVGGIMFHSVIYSKGKGLNKTSVKKLGRRASHGCIRLEVENAKWLYDNCPTGTTVVIMD